MLAQDVVDSLHYVEKIYEWSRRNHAKSNIKEPIVIGGWAVDVYNSWFGSLDIDLITNSRTEQSLKYYLRKEEGFSIDDSFSNQKSIFKATDAGGKIDVDFTGNRISFEGMGDLTLNSKDYIKDSKHATLRNMIEITIPEITELWVYKVKAAWDRWYRLDNNTSQDVEWESGKLSKDYNDIVALIDSTEPLDPTTLSRCFDDFPFLRRVMVSLDEDSSLYSSYIQSSNGNEDIIKRKISRIHQEF